MVADGLRQEFKYAALLPAARGDGGPDAFAPLPSALAACALRRAASAAHVGRAEGVVLGARHVRRVQLLAGGGRGRCQQAGKRMNDENNSAFRLLKVLEHLKR